MKKAYISVNRQIIARNSRTGSRTPPISVRIGKSGRPWYGSKVKINGPSELVYDPERPILKCGARLIIIANADDVELM